jgi:exopolyphosphatase
MRRRPVSSLFLFIPLLALTTFACLRYYQLLHPYFSSEESGRLQNSRLHFGNISSKMASSPSFSLSEYLADKKKTLLDRLSQAPNDDSPIVIIMGNEAADTDSLASSILLSHLLSTSQTSESSKFPSSTSYVPLAQLPRADLKLRAENEMLLSILQVNATGVLFLDDLPSMDKLLRSDIFLGITDHPQLSNLWQPYDTFAEKVQVLVDHHADAQAHKEAKVRILMGPENGAIGCAVSVVVNMFKETAAIQELPSQLADLSLAAILIDTDDVSANLVGVA